MQGVEQNFLSMKYFNFGCLDRVASADPKSLANEATLEMLASSFCHLSPHRNCCRTGNFCNLASVAASIAQLDDQDSATDWLQSAIRFGPIRLKSLTQPDSASIFQSSSAGAIVVGFLGFAALLALATGLAVICGRRRGGVKLARLLTRLGLGTARDAEYSSAAVQQQNLLMQRLNERDADSERRLVPQPTSRDFHQHQQQQEEQRQSVECYSSSGYGNPSLVQRTIARDTTVDQSVGQGRFGQVFKGIWRTGDVSDIVAIKIFHSRAEASWSREGEIYATPGLAHPAILGFIAMDNLDAGWETQLWLITDYHPNGSLQAYLTQHSIDPRVAAGMCHSIVSGLSHLHTELNCFGFTKPGIAHCDVKSNNILVKSDLTCCLADFGLAVKETDRIRRDGERRVGTVRYLSPELIESNASPQDFNALKKADLYSLGLVLWEIGHRCQGSNPYSLPYAESVPPNPSLEDMRRIVCRPQCGRPAMRSADWLAANPLCAGLANGLLDALWHPEPLQRLDALEVKRITAGIVDIIAGQNIH